MNNNVNFPDPNRRNSTTGGGGGNGVGGGRGPGFFNGGFGGGRAQFDDLGPTTRVSVWILTGASLIFLLLRVYCKLVRYRRLHPDDYFSIAAWVCLSLFSYGAQSSPLTHCPSLV